MDDLENYFSMQDKIKELESKIKSLTMANGITLLSSKKVVAEDQINRWAKGDYKITLKRISENLELNFYTVINISNKLKREKR